MSLRPVLLRQPGLLSALSGARTLTTWQKSMVDRNSTSNAFVHIPEHPLVGKSTGPLAGIEVAVKDNICTKSMPTTASSEMLRGMSSHHILT
jgi:aspartyl-tRNA(Asn)/glutamyl-tRNA(Gln) amidotransferase subunit A